MISVIIPGDFRRAPKESRRRVKQYCGYQNFLGLGRPMLHGPVELTIHFGFARPGVKDGEKPGAGDQWASGLAEHITELTKTVCDGLAGVMIKDSNQVVKLSASVMYGRGAFTRVLLEPLEPSEFLL